METGADFGKRTASRVEENLQAEKLRLWLEERDFTAIRKFFESHSVEERLGQNGNWDYALLEVTLAFWRESLKNSASEAPAGEREVRTILEQIRRKDSPWWIRKSEMLFAMTTHQMEEEGILSENLPMQVWTAEQACRSGDEEKALSACEKAWQTAERSRERDSAIRVGRWAAAMLCEKKKWSEAAEWFRKMSLAFPDDTEAVKNHTVAIQLVEKWVEETLQRSRFENRPEEVDRVLEHYQVFLVEHYQFFAEKDSAIVNILQKLEKLTRIRQKKDARVDVAMILTTRTEGEAYQKALADAVQAWDDYLRTFPRENSERLTKTAQKAILWSEKQPLAPREFLITLGWQLEFLPPMAEQVERKLRIRLQQERWEVETRISGQILLVLAMVLQGKTETVADELRKITDTSDQHATEMLLKILEKIKERLQESPTESARKRWAKLEWELLSRLDQEK
ncbi:MAG: hypothetical protein Q4E67_02430, partial [Planctomycetia bacterium]|nr:hypothetical protein [Planctomycetia bacterium]